MKKNYIPIQYRNKRQLETRLYAGEQLLNHYHNQGQTGLSKWPWKNISVHPLANLEYITCNNLISSTTICYSLYFQG